MEKITNFMQVNGKLKIKNNINLEELTKFGFKENAFLKEYVYNCVIVEINRRIISCLDNGDENLNKINELIENDFVEEI